MVHLNLEDKSQEDIPDLYIFNLTEENPDTSIEASMFVNDYYPFEISNRDSLANSLDKESDHALLLIHNHNLFQKGSINPNCILLGTGSSIDVFCNPSLLKNIHRLVKITRIHCNSGVVSVTHKGTLTGYGLVWFNRDGIAKIFSMANATKKLPITYDSSTGDKFILQKDIEQLIFNRSPLGLYFHDASS